MTKLKPPLRVKRIGRITLRRRFRFHTAHVRRMRITGSCHLTQPETRKEKLNLLSEAASPRPDSARRKIKPPLFHVQMRYYEPTMLKVNCRQALLVKFFPV